MYLLKELSYEPLLSKFRATNGLQVLMRENSVTAWPGMWGETEINLGIFADISKFEQLQKNNNRDYFMTYANEVAMEEDSVNKRKKLILNVSTYQPDKIEGYIVFIRRQNDIKTNGEKLYSNLACAIVILKEGQYVEFEGKRAEVINQKLYLQV